MIRSACEASGTIEARRVQPDQNIRPASLPLKPREMVSASVKALSLMCDGGVVEKALLFGSFYSLDELESGDGNGGKPSSSRNLLCLIVAFWIVFSIISNTP